MSKKRSEHRREQRRQQAQRDAARRKRDEILRPDTAAPPNSTSSFGDQAMKSFLKAYAAGSRRPTGGTNLMFNVKKNFDLDALSVAWNVVDEVDQIDQSRPTTPTFSECVVGYRLWVVDAIGRLRAVTMTKQVWVPGENVALCRPEDHQLNFSLGASFAEQHDAPHEKCGCGLYAWNDCRPTSGSRTMMDEYGVLRVFGGVAAWGDLRVHRDGFRAERACPVALSYDDETDGRVRDLLRRVADDYGVALVHAEALQAEVEQHGTPLPVDVRPDVRRTLYCDMRGFAWYSNGGWSQPWSPSV